MAFAQILLETLLLDLPLILGPVVLCVAATLMLWPCDAFVPHRAKKVWAPVTMAILAVVGVLVFMTPEGSGFSRMFRMDGFTRGFQLLCTAATFITVMLSQPQMNALEEQTAEYYALLLYSLAGMQLLAGATDLVSVYFSVELMAICVYILVAYLRTHERSIEAGMKYFLLGAFSSGILLYGMSLLFAAGGGTTTNLVSLNEKLALTSNNSSLLVFSGALMVLVGFAFKVAAVPFHMWSPDAYEGAPTPITAFMSMAPKAASLAAFLRVFGTGLPSVYSSWAVPLAFIAGASMIVGNIAALRQQSMKRMLAYSSIAHVGYMLLGVLSRDTQGGSQAVWLYMFTYLFMQSGAFAIVIHLQGTGEGERLEDFRGLARRKPGVAFAMMVFMLSLAGIPPLLGFFSKFYLFMLAIQQGQYLLTTIALLTSAVAAYYYLAVVNLMYFKDQPGESEVRPLGRQMSLIVSSACAAILVGTCFGPWLLDWARRISWL